MANFLPAYEKVLLAEGGYQLTDIANDRGGLPYAGIARKPNPSWGGWNIIDRGETPPADMVRRFYRDNFWDKIRGDEIKDQHVAELLYDFAVNAGVSTTIKLAQIVVGATPDGKVGPKTLEAWNSCDPRMFSYAFSIAKITRYRDIVARDKTQLKFLVGWVSRTLHALKGMA